MSTQRLYYADAYRREFAARVRERLVHGGKPAVVLDQTLFYPESGGQPADRGSLGGASVLYVFEDGERIVHVLDRELAGQEEVRGTVDWARRFDHMQQHTGQHILSQCFVEVLKGETQSFHLGEQVSTLEVGLSAVLGLDLERVEARANEVVFEDREIKTYFVEPERVAAVPLRRPPKKEGTIRVVEVNGFDFSACGGTHCRRTGEIGLIKVIRWDKIRNNVRFEFLCGRRAWKDYSLKNRSLLEISQRFSVNEREAPACAARIVEDAKSLRKKQRQLQEALAGYEAGEAIGREPGPLIARVLSDKTAEEAKLLALNIIRRAEKAVLFAVEGRERDHFVFAGSDKLALNMRDLVPVVSSLVKAKGGGSASLVELVADKGSDLRAVLAAAGEYLKEKLPSPRRG